MRVLVVEDDLHPHGGQERCLLEFTAGLSGRGHQIDLLYRSFGESFDEYRRFCRDIHRIPGHLLEGRRPVQSVLRWLRSTSIAARGEHDIVYINQHQDSPFGAAVATLKRIPLVCHLHQAPPAGWGIQWALARSKITRYIAVSHHTRAQYLARGVPPSLIDIVHNGIDLCRYRETDVSQRAASRRALDIPLAAFVVLYAGRLDPEKGIEDLIDAYALLGLSPDQGRLVVAGAPRNHRDAAAAAAYVASLHARSTPRTTVWLDWQPEMRPLYGMADVTVLPSPIDEPLGRTTIEAMACGRPALASAVGGSLEVLTGSFRRGLFPPGNPQALAGTLAEFSQWQTHEPELGAACREHVRANFSLERAVDQIEHILTQAIDGQSPSRD